MPLQKAPLAEIGVFGNDSKTILSGVLPNGRIVCLDQPDLAEGQRRQGL